MQSRRFFSQALLKKLEEQIPKTRERVKALNTKHGNTPVGTYTIGEVIQGSKGINSLFYLCSSLDADEGIRFRGKSIPEMIAALPQKHGDPLPEAVFWMLLTGEAPTKDELHDLQTSILSKGDVPKSTLDLVKAQAKAHHPMTTLSMALLDMQKNSVFAKEYEKGLKKDKFYGPTLVDALNIIRALPEVAGLIYTTKYDKKPIALESNDWAGQYANFMGFKDNEKVTSVLRSYLAIHTDHEGGNVSAHTGYLVNSALSDPYLAMSSMINGLAGPLHGLANQEVMRFIFEVDKDLKAKNVNFTHGNDPALLKEVDHFIRHWLKTAVVPGYGHGKLRKIDPRFTHLQGLAHKIIPNSRYFHIVQAIQNTATPILLSLGKVKNPYPNVDSHSGVLLYDTGLTQFDYYTAVFGVSRALGVLANMIWARALGLNIERPGSLTLEALEQIAAKH